VADVGADVAAALAGWLAARGIEADVMVEARTTVGLSQETWLVRVVQNAGSREVVLRLPTPASGVRSILTQRTALQSVAGRGLPVPELIWFDDTAENPFERPFIVMERSPGTVPVGWHELLDENRVALAEQAIDVLADLHAIDVSRTPLSDLPGSPLMDIDGLRKLFGRLAPLPPVVNAAFWWLDRHRPPPSDRRTIVHGDYRMGNMVVEHKRITGVLDWEMAAPGDPLTDLVWCFIPVWVPSLVEEAPLLARYADRAGVALDLDSLHWHRVFGLLRLAYYSLSGTRAFDSGRSTDLRLAALRLQLPVNLDRVAAAIAGDPVT
jgi:aminoglycoside phosphotransferase (APT) family kinase protein